jgi:hypothetical protein
VSLVKYARVLGDTTERLWVERRSGEAWFPEVAARALADTPIPPGVTADDLLEELVLLPELPVQEDLDASFGEPPVTLYRSRSFFVSALFWFDGTTAIHEHAFSGAFRVLTGSSVHLPYVFNCQDAVTRRLAFGELVPGQAELLQAGDIRPILLGGDGIHSLFHLDRPSVTLVVRTYREPSATPRFKYLRPGLAFDPFYRDPDLHRQVQVLRALAELDPDRALKSATDLVRRLDLFHGFLVLNNWCELIERGASLDHLVDVMADRHGHLGAVLSDVFSERRRELALVARRRVLTDARHRAFLAVLLTRPPREARDAILATLFPGRGSANLMAELVREFSSQDRREQAGLALNPEELSFWGAA